MVILTEAGTGYTQKCIKGFGTVIKKKKRCFNVRELKGVSPAFELDQGLKG